MDGDGSRMAKYIAPLSSTPSEDPPGHVERIDQEPDEGEAEFYFIWRVWEDLAVWFTIIRPAWSMRR